MVTKAHQNAAGMLGNVLRGRVLAIGRATWKATGEATGEASAGEATARGTGGNAQEF